ncbi:MAG: hypothetical protein M3Y50_16580 [Acidobacteriota bacterium]|nr:hypothetical protein [Acidobacteriota bacterium]
MSTVERRSFLKLLALTGISMGFEPDALFAEGDMGSVPRGAYTPGRIVNEYSLLLPGEREALARAPAVTRIEGGAVWVGGNSARAIEVDQSIEGWRLLATLEINGSETAVFEKHVTHRGAIAYVTVAEGTIALIPKLVGDLSKIRPRPTDTSHGIRFERKARYQPGPDVLAEYILNSKEDPSYENVAALGLEYIGWTLVGNEQGGPERSLYLQPDGQSRELKNPNGQAAWAPDEYGPVFDPQEFFPNDNIQMWRYEKGFSKRALLGGYTPVADTGVWNAEFQCGYEAMVLVPPGEDARPMSRMRVMVPDDQIAPGMKVYLEGGRAFIDHYANGSREAYFSELAGIWNRWHSFYEESMPVEIPDGWLLDAARAGITLSRCSYRGLEPTYQMGEGGYTKIPERSHALFPVAQYEFIWAHQLWNLTESSDPYFQFYLDKYILPDGNFLYNTQDQVEAPLNVGLFLANSARGYFYTYDLNAFEQRLPVLDRMIGYVLQRYDYSKTQYGPDDRRYGLIWGSPEADLGDPHNDFPDSHPFYYQNAVGVWRGLNDHARALELASKQNAELGTAAARYTAIAAEMRTNITRSLNATLAARDLKMKKAGIPPFTPNDLNHRPTELSSYENHRFMQDWFLADWGDAELDIGHLKHRETAGMEMLGLHTDGVSDRTSNFMDHGSLAVKIRQKNYRPFLLNLYALVCFAADSGNRYAPEDVFLPGGHPEEGSRYGWSAVINSTLQPTLGLRWLLCYEESDTPVCHLQKAAPKHWFAAGEHIEVKRCPTRFGTVGWRTEALPGRRWKVSITLPEVFLADLHVHVHPPDGMPIASASLGGIDGPVIIVDREAHAGKTNLVLEIV